MAAKEVNTMKDDPNPCVNELVTLNATNKVGLVTKAPTKANIVIATV